MKKAVRVLLTQTQDKEVVSKKSKCINNDKYRRKNLKETSSNYDMDGETYECKICGEYYRLYYDDMK